MLTEFVGLSSHGGQIVSGLVDVVRNRVDIPFVAFFFWDEGIDKCVHDYPLLGFMRLVKWLQKEKDGITPTTDPVENQWWDCARYVALRLS